MAELLISTLWSRSVDTLADTMDRVRGDLGLRDNSALLTDQDLIAWLFEGQTIIARDSQVFEASFSIPTTSGTAEYQLPFDANARAISVREVLYKNLPLADLSLNVLYAYDYKWRSAPAAANPVGYYQRGMSAIGLYPAPNASGAADLVVTAVVLPPKVTAPEDFLYVPTGCEDAPITYAKLMASMKDAYGEGRDRIPIYREEWKLAKLRASQLVDEAKGNEIVRMGENALLADLRSPFGFRWDPWQTATRLP